MVSNTKEVALEQAIQRHLTGLTSEELAGQPGPAGHGPFRLGQPTDFDAEYALDTRLFWEFLETTQGRELAKLKARNPGDWQGKILERFDRLIKKNGVLHLLKKGLNVDDAFFALMYPAPLASSAAKVHENFAANIFSVTRQVRYSQTNPGEEIDMVLFVNGLPLTTIELKNAWTGQTARYHGQKQYRTGRDATQPLLQFGRALVHMAVDTDEVFMTTKLAGPATFFLPFNKGHNEGEGNPPNPHGHKTAYLWEEVFTKESLAGIIQHFVLLEGKATDPLAKKTLIFPRYHQLEVVRRLLAHAATTGVGHSYLIQHSAGSGKSNSITWTAYQLIETYPAKAGIPGAKGLDQPLFDSVIVVTDRRLLDKQLRENIKDFSEVKNIVAPAMRSADLKSALENGKKIIITTIQKFPFIIDGIADLAGAKPGGQVPVLALDVMHDSRSGPGQQRRHHQPHALSRPGRRETEHMLGPVMAQIITVEPPQHHTVSTQQPRARHLGPGRPAGRAIGVEVSRLACADHGHGDGHGDRDEPARRGDGRPFPEDAPRIGVKEIPPPEEGGRRVDRDAPEVEPDRAQLRLKPQPPGHPLRRTPGRDEHDEGHGQDLAPEDFRGGHGGYGWGAGRSVKRFLLAVAGSAVVA